MKIKNKVLSRMIVLALLVAVVSVPVNMWVNAELTYEPGGHDGDVETFIALGAWDAINTGVMNGSISAGKAEEVLNRGYCLGYMQAWKDAGKIPADFTPTSASSSTSSSSSSISTNTDTSASTTTTTAETTKADTTPKYSDEEIEKAWKLVTTVDATCATDGYKEYKNSLTGKTKTESIPATGEHDYQIAESTDATCTEKGSVTYTCSVCGDTYTEEVEATDHDYVIVESVEPTCTEDGYTKYECTLCGDSYGETLKATGHDEGEWVTTKDASLFSNGTKELRCTVCGEVLETEEISQTCPIPLAGVVGIAVVVVGGIGVVVFVVKKKKETKAETKSSL